VSGLRVRRLDTDISNDRRPPENKAKIRVFQYLKPKAGKNIGQFLNLSQNLLDTSTATP
jgi:hypothetical protein